MGFTEVTWGAIFVAVITGLISLLSLIISKEQKVSEFRQSWIDAFRLEASKIVAHSHAILDGRRIYPEWEKSSWESMREDFIAINDYSARLKLRIYAQERPSKAVLKILEEYEDFLNPGASLDALRMNQLSERFSMEVGVILKAEWQKVRDGERIFRLAQRIAGALLIVILVALAVAVVAMVSGRKLVDQTSNHGQTSASANVSSRSGGREVISPNGK